MKNEIKSSVNYGLVAWLVASGITAGAAHLGFWSTVFCLAAWPYYLGEIVAQVAGVR